MSLGSRVKTWWKAMSRPDNLAAQVQEELEFHIENYADDLMHTGVPRSEALRRARAELGSVAAGKENCRQAWGTRFLDQLVADLRFAIRMLRKSPAFTLIAVGSLGLGIGANTAVFSIAKQVLLDQLPVPRPGELRLLAWRSGPKTAVHSSWGEWDKNADGVTSTSFSYPVYEQLRKQNSGLSELFAYKNIGLANVTANGEAEVVSSDVVSGNFFGQMEIQPQLGRAIELADDRVGAPAVADISDAYWTRRFNRSPAVIGSTILVNLVPVTIIGVTPPRFAGAKGTMNTSDLFLPFAMEPSVFPGAFPYHNGDTLLTSGRVWWMQIMARAKPGVDERKAQAELDAALGAAVQATTTVKKDESVPHMLLKDGSRGLNNAARTMQRPLVSLMALVGLVVLLACANIANLLLARSAARQREMSVRMALGARRGRVLRQVMTESLLLALLGGVAGLAVGWLGRNLLLRMSSSPMEPATLQGGFDWGVFVFNAALTIATGLLFGVVPAWQANRTPVSTSLKATAQTSSRRRRGITGKVIVGFQVALSTMLVVAAGIFLRTLVNLDRVDPGFDAKNLVLFELRPAQSRYAGIKQVQLFRDITDRLAAVPGVESVSLTSVAPLANNYENEDFKVQGASGQAESETAYDATVGDRYFATLRIPIVAGRGFTSADTESSLKVAVVNQALVKQFFSGQNPIGKTFLTSDVKNNKLQYQVVGVSADAHYGNLRDDPPPVFYMDYKQAPEMDWGTSFAVRTHMSRAAITPQLRRAVQAVDQNLPLTDVRTEQEQIDQLLMNERIFADLTAGFGVLALVLACIGIYGITAYTVSQRTNEIGIRMALGAEPGRMLRMVLREASTLALGGVLFGAAAALALGRVIGTMLYGLKPWDPATMLGSAAVLVLVALAASWIPARRAAGIEPMQALRHE